jgi:hypothetical protein
MSPILPGLVSPVYVKYFTLAMILVQTIFKTEQYNVLKKCSIYLYVLYVGIQCLFYHRVSK